MPAFIVPLVLGLTAGVGSITGVASVALQGVQQAQYTKQLEEQEEIARLQKKLTQHQLKQFEDQEKLDKEQHEMNLFRSPTMIRSGAVTRSVTRANVTGAAPIVRVSPAPSIPRTLSTVSLGSSVDLGGPGSLSRHASQQSLIGSTESLNVQHGQFARDLQARFNPLPDLNDGMELRQRPVLVSPPPNLVPETSFGGIDLRNARRQIPQTPIGAYQSFGDVHYNLLNDDDGFNALPNLNAVPNLNRRIGVRPILRAVRRIPGRIRGLFPVHTVGMGQNQPLIPGIQNGRRASIGRFLNTHKRKLIVGGAVLGGAAIIGGTVGGILSKRQKTVFEDINKPSMQAGEPMGIFQELSADGGGGGGFAKYQQLQAAARAYDSHSAPKRRKGGRKKKSRKHATKKSGKKTYQRVKRGGIRKRKGKKAVCSINKKGKKVCKKRRTAF